MHFSQASGESSEYSLSQLCFVYKANFNSKIKSPTTAMYCS